MTKDENPTNENSLGVLTDPNRPMTVCVVDGRLQVTVAAKWLRDAPDDGPTIKLWKLIDHVNRRNRCSVVGPAWRSGWNEIAEEELVAAGRYAGYVLLAAEQLEGDARGNTPGVGFLDNGMKITRVTGDPTRRAYCVKGRPAPCRGPVQL